MAGTNYPGNPNTAEAPGPQPMPGETPIANIPNDGDALNAASVAQAHKEAMDYVAYLMYPGQRLVDQHSFWGTTTSIYTTIQQPVPGEQDLVLNFVATSTAQFLDPSSTSGITPVYNGIMLKMVNGATTSGTAVLNTPRPAWFPDATKTQLCFEQDVAMASVASGSFYIGLTNSLPILASGNWFGIAGGGGSINCNIVFDGGNTTHAMAATVPLDNTVQRWRILFSGAATPAGVANSNTQFMRVYLNNSLVATQNGPFTSSTGRTAFYPFVSVQPGSVTDIGTVYFGGWTVSVNRY